jgi:hypothetical protein
MGIFLAVGSAAGCFFDSRWVQQRQSRQAALASAKPAELSATPAAPAGGETEIPSKKTGTCPKCEGTRVMRVDRVADAAEWQGYGAGDLSKRSGTAPRREAFLGTQEDFALTGDVEAFVGADCGYFEEYLRDPSSIDWSTIAHATRWSPPRGGGGPFRCRATCAHAGPSTSRRH